MNFQTITILHIELMSKYQRKELKGTISLNQEQNSFAIPANKEIWDIINSLIREYQ